MPLAVNDLAHGKPSAFSNGITEVLMAQCAYCNAVTELYFANVPVCTKCTSEREANRKPAEVHSQIHTVLKDELAVATEQAVQATETFLRVTTEIPSGLPHPDGTQRIHNASHDMSQARERMALSHKRLNDYLTSGIVPEDLKRSG